MICATAAALEFQSPLRTQEEKVKVPGENPLNYCKPPKDYLVNIEYINLTPNPPVPGMNLTITAGGTVSKEIDTGKVHVKVVWNYVALINRELDLCESVKEVNLTCPLKTRFLNITKEVEIPKAVPPGKYVVTADVYMNDPKEEITCLEGIMTF